VVQPAALAEASDNAFSWLRDNLAEFAPDNGTTPREWIRLLKPITELVLLTSVLTRDERDCPPAVELGRSAWRTLRQGDSLFNLLAARPDLIEIAGLVADFEDLGLGSPRLRTLVGEVARMDTIAALGLPDWRATALVHNLHRLGLRARPPELSERSWLVRRPEPWTLTAITAYPLTHDVYHLTDFGRRPEAISARSRAYLRLWQPCWVERFVGEKKWDMVAELLAVAQCIGVDETDRAWLNDTLADLLATQRLDGGFPGPIGAGKPLIRSVDQPERVAFLTDYHTTLVALLVMCWTRHGPVRDTVTGHDRSVGGVRDAVEPSEPSGRPMEVGALRGAEVTG
jgi:hypothetical protein